MRKEGLLILIITIIGAWVILTHSNISLTGSKLASFNSRNYTLIATSQDHTMILIRNDNTYFYTSDGTTYRIVNDFYATTIVPGTTTVYYPVVLNRPFSEGNLAHYVFKGLIFFPTRSSQTQTINLNVLYSAGKYMFSPMYGTAVFTVIVSQKTMVAFNEKNSIWITLIG